MFDSVGSVLTVTQATQGHGKSDASADKSKRFKQRIRESVRLASVCLSLVCLPAQWKLKAHIIQHRIDEDVVDIYIIFQLDAERPRRLF